MKINLSKTTVETLLKYDFDLGSATTDAEAEEMERYADDLASADRNRDERGRLELRKETFEYVMDKLDWYASAYWADTQANANGVLELTDK